MKYLAILLLICFIIGCATTKSTTFNASSLNGTWVPVKQEIGGTLLPKKVYENTKLILRDGTYTEIAESVDKGIVEYKGDKMDIYGKDGVNAGKHFTAIYKYEHGQLIICYNLAGDSYPESFETKSKPTLFLSVFKKRFAN